MNGKDFVTLAVQLANGTTEAHFRTSVSRAYYGAFHVARQLIEQMGVRLPRNYEEHKKVLFCLQGCGDIDATTAGKWLESLRRERNIADYDLHESKYSHPEEAKYQVNRARRILETLERCRSKSEFRSKVQTYALQVLRLSVLD